LWLILLKNLNKPLKVLGIVLLVTMGAELYAFNLMLRRANNLFIFHILVPVQYIFYCVILYFELHSTFIRKAIIASIFFLVAISIFFALNTQGVHEYNSYVIIYRHFFLVLWILTFFRQMFVKVEISNPLYEPMFWLSTGLLFYSLGNFFIDGYMNFLIRKSLVVARRIYFVNVLLGLFMYILFIVSFLSFKVAYKKGE